MASNSSRRASSSSNSDDRRSSDRRRPRTVGAISGRSIDSLSRVSLPIRDRGSVYSGTSSGPSSSSSSSQRSHPPPPSLSPSVSSSATSYDFDRDSDDLASDLDAQSALLSLSPAPSLYSLTNSLRESAIRIEYGRSVNANSDVYHFAADEAEAKRLDMQHAIYKEIVGNYAPPYNEVLADNDDPLTPRTCLDIGCGSGAWIIDLARDFPHVSCVAVDLVPMPALPMLPPNVRFEVDDVNLGLEHFAGDFDVVHARLISAGIKDYYKLIQDTAMMLRPRGLADFWEFDYRLYDTQHRLILPTTQEIWGNYTPPDGWLGTGMARTGLRPATGHRTQRPSSPSPYLARWFTVVSQGARKRGGHIDAAALMHRWVTEHSSFEEVKYREFWIPSSSWLSSKEEFRRLPEYRSMSDAEFKKWCWAGQTITKDIDEFFDNGRILLLSTGVPSELIDELIANTRRELREGQIPMYFRMQNVYARKKIPQPPQRPIVLSFLRGSPVRDD